MVKSPIDADAFAELLETVGGDREFLAELVETYLTDSPSLFAELRAALAAGDAEAARRAAHTLKSTSATFGALALAGRCRDLEAAAARGDLSDLEADVERAAADYEDVANALRATVTAGETR